MSSDQASGGPAGRGRKLLRGGSPSPGWFVREEGGGGANGSSRSSSPLPVSDASLDAKSRIMLTIQSLAGKQLSVVLKIINFLFI